MTRDEAIVEAKRRRPSDPDASWIVTSRERRVDGGSHRRGANQVHREGDESFAGRASGRCRACVLAREAKDRASIRAVVQPHDSSEDRRMPDIIHERRVRALVVNQIAGDCQGCQQRPVGWAPARTLRSSVLLMVPRRAGRQS